MNRERLKILRDYLASLPDERVNMSAYFCSDDDWLTVDDLSEVPSLLSGCGTAACVAGWSVFLWGGAGSGDHTDDIAADHLGLSVDQSEDLFRPSGWSINRQARADVIAAIDSMLANPDDDALPVWPEKAVSE